MIRQSLKTRVWDIAQKKARDWETAGMVFVTVKEGGSDLLKIASQEVWATHSSANID